MNVRERLVETIRARGLCMAAGDLDGVDQMTNEIDDLLEQMSDELRAADAVE